MDFDLTHEQQQILGYGDSIAKKFDRKYWMECAEKHVFPQALYQQVARDGFVGTMVPEEYGGAGQGMVEMHLFLEGLSNNGIPLLNLVVGATISLGFIETLGPDAAGRVVYFMSVEGAKFRRPVLPGDQLRIHVTKDRNRGNVWKFSAVARVDGVSVAEATYAAMIMDKATDR